VSDADTAGRPAGCLGRPVQLFLKALASEGRQQAMMLFSGGAELSVGDVAARLGTGQSTASQQLALLREGGLLSARRDGKTVLVPGRRGRDRRGAGGAAGAPAGLLARPGDRAVGRSPAWTGHARQP
jgi:DNA-binding transcriptional ArsR family regulator